MPSATANCPMGKGIVGVLNSSVTPTRLPLPSSLCSTSVHNSAHLTLIMTSFCYLFFKDRRCIRLPSCDSQQRSYNQLTIDILACQLLAVWRSHRPVQIP